MPAYQGREGEVTDGIPYTGPFQISASALVRASAIAEGLGAGQASGSVTLKVSTPVVSHVPVPGVVTVSPALVNVSVLTPGATVVYTFTDVFGTTEGEGALFQVETSGNLTVRAVKPGALDSEEVRLEYSMRVADPVLPESGTYTSRVPVTITSETPQAQIFFTVCNATGPEAFPNPGNRSQGEVDQAPTDVTCYPGCKGKCSGGEFEGATCGGIDDQLTCGGHGRVRGELPAGPAGASPRAGCRARRPSLCPSSSPRTSGAREPTSRSSRRRAGLADSAELVRVYDIVSTPPDLRVV